MYRILYMYLCFGSNPVMSWQGIIELVLSLCADVWVMVSTNGRRLPYKFSWHCHSLVFSHFQQPAVLIEAHPYYLIRKVICLLLCIRYNRFGKWCCRGDGMWNAGQGLLSSCRNANYGRADTATLRQRMHWRTSLSFMGQHDSPYLRPKNRL